jgi:RNA polymerase sigma-70 factor (ECF subfamily)
MLRDVDNFAMAADAARREAAPKRAQRTPRHPTGTAAAKPVRLHLVDSDHAASQAAPETPAAAGDQATDLAVAALFRAHYPRVEAYLRRRLTDPESARDLAAEVFRLAWERATTPPGVVPSAPWCFVTARNLLANARRQATRRAGTMAAIVGELSREPVPGATAGPDQQPGDPLGHVAVALSALPERHREILMAHYWDGLTGPECAHLLGCSTPAVWMRLTRARNAFRQLYTTLEVQP